MSRIVELPNIGLAYAVTGKPRADGRVLYGLYGQDKKVWRMPPGTIVLKPKGPTNVG